MDATPALLQFKIIGRRTQPIKQLKRFEKNYRIPTQVTRADLQFLQKLCEEEINADIDHKFQLFRSAFNLKRKEIEARGSMEGLGTVVTACFQYQYEIGFSEQDPSLVLWQRQIDRIGETSILGNPVWSEVFTGDIVELEVVLADATDLEGIIDGIEDLDSDELSVDYDRELTYCDVKLKSSGGSLRFSGNSIRVNCGIGLATPQRLIDVWFLFQERLGAIL